jgi:hypothetical protein
MIFLSNTTATMLALVVVRNGFVYRSEHTFGWRDHSSSRLRDFHTFSTRAVLPALDRHRSLRAALICSGIAALSCRSVELFLFGMMLERGPVGRAQDTAPSVILLRDSIEMSRH